eukprot:Lankesteria_metandrocarpae@DN1867_c0_g1_i1.p1
MQFTVYIYIWDGRATRLRILIADSCSSKIAFECHRLSIMVLCSTIRASNCNAYKPTAMTALLVVGFLISLSTATGSDIPPPSPTKAKPLDANNDCHYRVWGFENYIFRATTDSNDGQPIYQAYIEDTCTPLNRYLYRFESPIKKQKSWLIVPDFSSATVVAGLVHGMWDGCTSTDRIIDHGEKHVSRMHRWIGPGCKQPQPAVALPVDDSNDCLLKFIGYGEYTFRPIQRSNGGEPIYQGVDPTTCTPLNRFLYRWFNSSYNTYEWNVDNDLKMSGDAIGGGRLGFVNDFRGCPVKRRDVYMWETDGYVQDSWLAKTLPPLCDTTTTTTTTATTTTTTTATATTTGAAAPHYQMPAGEIAGAAVGAVVLLGLLGAGGYAAFKKLSGGADSDSLNELDVGIATQEVAATPRDMVANPEDLAYVNSSDVEQGL